MIPCHTLVLFLKVVRDVRGEFDERVSLEADQLVCTRVPWHHGDLVAAARAEPLPVLVRLHRVTLHIHGGRDKSQSLGWKEEGFTLRRVDFQRK